MEIRNNSEALNAFLGVSSNRSIKPAAVRGQEAQEAGAAFSGDEATLSNVGAAMQSAADRDGVRLDKVAAIQQALAAGTYNVSASEVADKLVESMLMASATPKR